MKHQTEALTIGTVGGRGTQTLAQPLNRFPPQPPERVPEDYRQVIGDLLDMADEDPEQTEETAMHFDEWLQQRKMREATTTGGGGYSGAHPIGEPLRAQRPSIGSDYLAKIGHLLQMADGEMDEQLRLELEERNALEERRGGMDIERLTRMVVAKASDRQARKELARQILRRNDASPIHTVAEGNVQVAIMLLAENPQLVPLLQRYLSQNNRARRFWTDLLSRLTTRPQGTQGKIGLMLLAQMVQTRPQDVNLNPAQYSSLLDALTRGDVQGNDALYDGLAQLGWNNPALARAVVNKADKARWRLLESVQLLLNRDGGVKQAIQRALTATGISAAYQFIGQYDEIAASEQTLTWEQPMAAWDASDSYEMESEDASLVTGTRCRFDDDVRCGRLFLFWEDFYDGQWHGEHVELMATVVAQINRLDEASESFARQDVLKYLSRAETLMTAIGETIQYTANEDY